MGFFSDLKEDLSQAVGNVDAVAGDADGIPGDSIGDSIESAAGIGDGDVDFSLEEMLENIDNVAFPTESTSDGILGSAESEQSSELSMEEMLAAAVDSLPEEDVGEMPDYGDLVLDDAAVAALMEETSESAPEEAADAGMPEADYDDIVLDDELAALLAEATPIDDESGAEIPVEEAEAMEEAEIPALDLDMGLEAGVEMPTADAEVMEEAEIPTLDLDMGMEAAAQMPTADAEVLAGVEFPALDVESALAGTTLPEASETDNVTQEELTALLTQDTMTIEAEASTSASEKPVEADQAPTETITHTATQQARRPVEGAAVLTAGMHVKGDINADGAIDVQGVVDGSIVTAGKISVTGKINGDSMASEFYAQGARIKGDITVEGAVKIGANSVVIGNIESKSAAIAGAVKGNIDVRGPVILDSSAVVVGNIKFKSIQINNGAVIEGTCQQCYADVNPTSFFDE